MNIVLNKTWKKLRRYNDRACWKIKFLRLKKPHSIVNPQPNVRNPPSLNPAFPQPRLVSFYFEKKYQTLYRKKNKKDFKNFKDFENEFSVDLELSREWIWIKCTCKIFSSNNNSSSINYSSNNFNINIQWVVLCIQACKVNIFFIVSVEKVEILRPGTR